MTTERNPDDLAYQFALLSPREQGAVFHLLDTLRAMSVMDRQLSRGLLVSAVVSDRMPPRFRDLNGSLVEVLDAVDKPGRVQFGTPADANMRAATVAALDIVAASHVGDAEQGMRLASQALQEVPANVMAAALASLAVDLLEQWAACLGSDPEPLRSSWTKHVRNLTEMIYPPTEGKASS